MRASSLILIGALVMRASASTITYNTDGFFNGGMILHSTAGATASLTFTPDGNTTVGVPSGINFGQFTLSCPGCGTQASGQDSSFNPFTIDLVVTDLTDNATGVFVGTSTGGLVFSDVSQIGINWSPAQLGPGDSNAISGNFGPTAVTISNSFTQIVAPNSGTDPDQTTVEGSVLTRFQSQR